MFHIAGFLQSGSARGSRQSDSYVGEQLENPGRRRIPNTEIRWRVIVVGFSLEIKSKSINVVCRMLV